MRTEIEVGQIYVAADGSHCGHIVTDVTTFAYCDDIVTTPFTASGLNRPGNRIDKYKLAVVRYSLITEKPEWMPSDLGEKEDGEKSMSYTQNADASAYLERIMASQSFFDVFKAFKNTYCASHDQDEDESDFDYVKRCAEQDFDDGSDANIYPDIAKAGSVIPKPSIIKMAYLIVPALTDQAGQCRIVSCANAPSNALHHYHTAPQKWAEAGLMNSRGELVCLNAPLHVTQEIKLCEPLMAGSVFYFDKKPTPKNIAIYDNGGETFDRYTVVYLNQPESKGLFGARGMSEHPFHPQGFGQYGPAIPGKHLGQMIEFEQLPDDCQRLVLNDLAADANETPALPEAPHG